MHVWPDALPAKQPRVLEHLFLYITCVCVCQAEGVNWMEPGVDESVS